MSPPSRTGPGGSVEPITTNKKVYNLEQVYLNIGNQHSQILSNINLNLLDPSGLQNKATVFRLSLITAFQFAETLPDAPAAEATRTRKDWIYALHLPVSHSSITAIDLCQLREALLTSPQSLKEFGRLLDSLGKIGLYAKEVKGTLDAAELITEVCRITRFDDLMHSMKMALDLLTATQLEWLCTDHPSFSYK